MEDFLFVGVGLGLLAVFGSNFVVGEAISERKIESSPGMPARGSKLLLTFKLYALYRKELKFTDLQQWHLHEWFSIVSNSALLRLAHDLWCHTSQLSQATALCDQLTSR